MSELTATQKDKLMADLRVVVYVHVTSPSGIVNVDPGVLPGQPGAQGLQQRACGMQQGRCRLHPARQLQPFA